MYDIRFMQSLFPAAEAEAAALGEKEPGTEHLILTTLDFQEGSARRVFERVGADPDQFRDAVAAQHAAALRSIGVEDDGAAIDDQIPPPPGRPNRAYHSAPSARHVFPEVVRLVKRDKSRLSGAYILLVASQMEYGTIARALDAMGVDRDELAAAAQAEVDDLNA
jgi:ATP-dependent Clp protease ATP-binding subunit ClpA